jgi:ABC-2 type transport system ATP-binding protein
MTNAIEAAGLVKTYGDVRALEGVSFSVREGSVFGLLGPNGAGKSTTVRILTTLTRPDEGSARVAGLDVLADPTGVRRSIGVVGQRSGVDPEATGRENLRLQGQVYDLPAHEREQRVDELLERFRLADAADRLVSGYSGGMQRRLDVALGLVSRPKVLFLDEPTTGLDPEVRAEMWQEIESLAGEHGVTVLLTTHYMEEAERLCDRVAVVDHGRLIALGTPRELVASLGAEHVIEFALEGGARALPPELLRALPSG